MIRITITAITLTAIATIALTTAAPVLAASSSDAPAATAEATVEGTESACAVDTEMGTLPCVDRDWSLGGLSNTGTSDTDRYEEVHPTFSTALRAGQGVVQTRATSSSTTETSFTDEARIRIGRPDDTIGEEVDWIMDAATTGASILSLKHMLIALAVVVGLIGAYGTTIVAVGVYALRRRNR
jgi:hypothetical protein